MASQFLEPPIPCDVRGTSQLAVASVAQRMACEDLDRFAHVRDRRQNRIAVRDEFQYPLEIRTTRGLNWTVAIFWRAPVWYTQRLGFEIGKDLLCIIHFSGVQDFVLASRMS